MQLGAYQLRVKRLILQAMPSMGAQYRRTLTSQLRGQDTDNLLEAGNILDAQHASGSFAERNHANWIAPLLTDLAQLKVEAKPVKIPAIYGSSMEVNLSSFIMELEFTHQPTTMTSTFIVAGYLSDPLPDEGEKIDANTTLTINSIFEYRTTRGGPEGDQSYTHQVNAAQVLYDPCYAGLDHPTLHRMSPEDVVSNIGTQELMGLASPQAVTDLRTMLTNYPVFVNYTDNDPTIWAERLLDANVRARREETLVDFGNKRLDHLAQMGAFLRNYSATHNPFLRAIALINDGRPAASFTIRDLLTIDTDCTKSLEILPAPEVDSKKKRVSLDDTSTNTVAGHYILNSVPAIMAKHGIRIAEFGARNFHNPARLWPSKIEGIHGEVDADAVTKFLEEVRIRVMDVISFNNTRSYHFGGCFDLFGLSGFAIELDREGTLNFLSPTFANTLFSPQLSDDRKDLDHNGQTFDEVFNLHKDML